MESPAITKDPGKSKVVIDLVVLFLGFFSLN